MNHNEDSAFDGPYVALVADGVGGAAAGEVASATDGVRRVRDRSGAVRRRSGDSSCSDAVATARESLRAGVRRGLERAGMATTLTAVVCDGRRVVLGHLGDSAGLPLPRR